MPRVCRSVPNNINNTINPSGLYIHKCGRDFAMIHSSTHVFGLAVQTGFRDDECASEMILLVPATQKKNTIHRHTLLLASNLQVRYVETGCGWMELLP